MSEEGSHAVFIIVHLKEGYIKMNAFQLISISDNLHVVLDIIKHHA